MSHPALALPAGPSVHAPAPPRRRTWTDRLTTGLLVGAALIALAVGVAAAFGVRMEVELTGSMRPAIAPNDMLVVHRIAAEQMRVGDIVSFASPSSPDVVITHRVRALHPAADGRLTVVTRGDANNTSERWAISRHGSVAKVIAVVPQLGALTDWTGRPAVRMAVFVLLGLMLLTIGLRAIWSEK